MAADDPLSPDASPGIASPQSGVRRVNNLPMYLVGGAVVAFLVIMGLVALDRAAEQKRQRMASDEKATSTSLFARAIAGSQRDGLIAAAVPPLAPPDKPLDIPPNAIGIVRPDLEAPPLPPRYAERQLAPPPDDERQRIRQMKLQQFEEALKARTRVQLVLAPGEESKELGREPGRSSARKTQEDLVRELAAARQKIDRETSDDPTAAYQARLRQLRTSGLAAGLGVEASASPSNRSSSRTPFVEAAAGRNDVSQFDRADQEDRWSLSSEPEVPRTPYVLRAGFVVPAVLISGINSDLPGQIMAQVSQDVYDTATGKWTLIPQGSRLVGRYGSDVAYGQARVLVAWQRIVFPDGKAMDIGAMPGADSAGYGGFADEVNNHYGRLFLSSFLMSGVTAGIAMSQNNGGNASTGFGGRPTASSALSEAVGQQLGQVTAQLIAKNINISPTLEIRPGYRFNVIVTKDMNFPRPYRAEWPSRAFDASP